MDIEILDGTTLNPLTKIGYNAGVCWGAQLEDTEKNRKRAITCIKAGHGRVLEYVDVELVISCVSARALRELYTHIGGSPTRLQASTRYISEADGFSYYVPPKIDVDDECKEKYISCMEGVQATYDFLLSKSMTKEDAANVLPLGMMSKMVWKINLRALINFMNRRLCMRALKEIRDLANEIKGRLGGLDEEWAWIADNLFVPTCEMYKYLNPNLVFCPEAQCCGKHRRIVDVKGLEF